MCLVVKNEQEEIIYWLAWYKALGFDTFIIYDDYSDDNTEEVILSLAPILDIRYMRNAVNHDLHNIRQVRAYNDAVTKYGKEFEWISFFDADEYLDLYGNSIKSYLRNFDNASLIAFNWCNVGTNGHVSRPVGPPITNYEYNGKNDLYWNRHTKVIFRPDKLAKKIYQVHNVSVHGESVDSEGLSVKWENEHGGFTSNPPTWKGGRLIHYQSRSIEHYVKRDKNIEDVRRDKGDPLHTVAKSEEYNSLFNPVSTVTLVKFYEWMLHFANQQARILIESLRAKPSGFLAELAHIVTPSNVSIFDPSYIPLQHEVDRNWISEEKLEGNIFKDIAIDNQPYVAFNIKNAFGNLLGAHEGELSLSINPEEALIGIYIHGSRYVHLFTKDGKGFRIEGDARILPALTFKVWRKEDRSGFLSHPRTGRFLGFTPQGEYSVKKIRALGWEVLHFEPIELQNLPKHILRAASYLGLANSLAALKEVNPSPELGALQINAITALDDVSREVVKLVSKGIMGEHLF
ncbi:glycosyltransferase family 92 protein [Oecophyllibacter saccharovorans]|uniref:glycosyltransferase family 92 protein n=1 Tax=Oecophyllibacter saccharovorans TaxID=2558360 RepID=UPI00143CD654|nr:glycosyltransferase family 92 protein [Oecophyllibacter saccharovorans]